MDHVWETFDDLFRTVYRQSQRIEGLELRLAQVERLLHEKADAAAAAVAATHGTELLQGRAERSIERAA